MEKMTITEALAEIKLIQKKNDKLRNHVLGNLVRAAHVPDPFDKDGGSQQANFAWLQSIKDSEARQLRIRSAIAMANLTTAITIKEETKTIFDWLTWRREIAETCATFYETIARNIKSRLDEMSSKPQVWKDTEEKTHLLQLIPNLSYPDKQAVALALRDKLEKLDGQLSLKNATIVIEF